MASAVQICNRALSECGISAFITSIDPADGSHESAICALHYADSVKAVLEDSNWGFSTKRADLQDIGLPPTNWGYRYRYPSDCLKARAIAVEGTINPLNTQRIPFEVVGDPDNSAKAICTNQQNAVLIYTVNVTDTTLFSNGFTRALVAFLASKIAGPLKDRAFADKLLQSYYVTLAAMAGSESNEGFSGPEPNGQLLSARE